MQGIHNIVLISWRTLKLMLKDFWYHIETEFEFLIRALVIAETQIPQSYMWIKRYILYSLWWGSSYFPDKLSGEKCCCHRRLSEFWAVTWQAEGQGPRRTWHIHRNCLESVQYHFEVEQNECSRLSHLTCISWSSKERNYSQKAKCDWRHCASAINLSCCHASLQRLSKVSAVVARGTVDTLSINNALNFPATMHFVTSYSFV